MTNLQRAKEVVDDLIKEGVLKESSYFIVLETLVEAFNKKDERPKEVE